MAENETIPTREEIAALPRWARVAFAARCARRVLPLFKHCRPKAPANFSQAVENSVNEAETAAANATEATLTKAAYSAAAAIAAEGISAASAARAAFYAYSDAQVDEIDSGAASEAARAVKQVPEAVSAIRFDFTTLSERATAEKWTDNTPVPPTVFGPMWPFGIPKDWPKEHAEENSVVTLTPPPDAPVEQIADFQIRLYEALNKLAIANGGAGLKVDSLGRDVPLVAPVGTGV